MKIRAEIVLREWALPLSVWYLNYIRTAGITILCLCIWIELPRNHGTSAGIPLTDQLIDELAQEAEEGYSTERLHPRNPHTHS